MKVFVKALGEANVLRNDELIKANFANIICFDPDYKTEVKRVMHSLLLGEQISLFFKSKPCKVLDLGCGPNVWTYPNYEITGLDCNPDQLRPGGMLYDINKDFPFSDESFDVVLGMEIIEHIENPWHFIRECKRVLKPDGDIFVTSPDVQAMSSRKLFMETGRLMYFQADDMKSDECHITPIFSWTMEKICKMNRLYMYSQVYNGFICTDEELIAQGIPPLFEPVMIYWLRKNDVLEIEGFPENAPTFSEECKKEYTVIVNTSEKNHV
jgi:ubiquinone/menaquinone biosynthesis C-methylase UbiE